MRVGLSWRVETQCTGMRCTEMARVTLRDILTPSGKVRDAVQLRAEITNPKLIAALDRYVQSRHAKRIGLSGCDDYAGLYPDAPMFFSSRKGGFSMVPKNRELESGETGEYVAADRLEHLFRRIFGRSGLKDCSSHSGRGTFDVQRHWRPTNLRNRIDVCCSCWIADLDRKDQPPLSAGKDDHAVAWGRWRPTKVSFRCPPTEDSGSHFFCAGYFS